MSYPAFIWKNPSFIGWHVRDANGVPVTGASVKATLYVGRSHDHPDTDPGAPITSMQNITLVEQLPDVPGFYKADLQASAIPGVSDDYVLVIEASMLSIVIGHWEETTAVVVRPPASPDLCTLDMVRQYLEIPDDQTDEDDKFRRWITACSADFLRRIRRPGFFPSRNYTESGTVFEGQIFLRNYPINSVTSVTVATGALPLIDPATVFDPSLAHLGYIFQPLLDEEERQSLFILGCDDMTPVQVTYNGGYNEIPADVSEAIAEWVGYKKGFAELQAKDQTSQWLQLGQYQQNEMIAGSTMKASEIDMPQSVASLISIYKMPILP